MLLCTDYCSTQPANQTSDSEKASGSYVTTSKSLILIGRDLSFSIKQCKQFGAFLRPTVEAVVFSLLEEIHKKLCLLPSHVSRRMQEKKIRFFFSF